MTTIFAKVPETIGVSDFRANLASYLAEAKKHPIFIADRKGGDTFIVMSIDAYNELVGVRARAHKNKNHKDIVVQ